MSKKGKKGEAKLSTTLGKISQIEENFEYIKPTYTNAPDEGVDFKAKMPHNFPEKLQSILNGNEEHPPVSNTEIEIRIDNKDYSGKIGKPVAQKFINDCDKNKDVAEHWLTGAKGLTKGAQAVLDESDYVTRYYSEENVETIDVFYQNELDNEIVVEREFDDEE